MIERAMYLPVIFSTAWSYGESVLESRLLESNARAIFDAQCNPIIDEMTLFLIAFPQSAGREAGFRSQWTEGR